MASRGEARTEQARIEQLRAKDVVDTVLAPAWSLRWQAPELALPFAERAVAALGPDGDRSARLRAEATVVFASCRLGQRLAVVDRAVDAVALAERWEHAGAGTSGTRSGPATSTANPTEAAELATLLRIELAGCARTAGVPLIGAAVLRPVLSAGQLRLSLRADALVALVGCLTQVAGTTEVDDALAEADRCYADDRDTDPDRRVVQRALVRAVASAQHRQRGAARAAVDAAQEGADLLGSLNRSIADNGVAAARLALHLVHGLLDLGRVDEASAVATRELARPVRAAGAATVGWLAMAMAVRRYLELDAPQPALGLLRDAVELAERHRLSALRAEALTALSDTYEQVGQWPDALDCLRTALGERLRRTRAVHAARTRLVAAFGKPDQPAEFVRLLSPPSGRRSASQAQGGQTQGGQAQSSRDQGANLLGRFGRRHTVELRTGDASTADVTVVLVDVHTPSGLGERLLRQVVDRVRDAAPSDAAVTRVSGAELAVLLPSGPLGQAERWVEALRGAMAQVDWAAFTPGLTVTVRTAPTQQAAKPVTAPALTPAAQPAATPAIPTPPPPAEQPAALAAPPIPAQPAPAAVDLFPAGLFDLPTIPLPAIRIDPPKPEPLVQEDVLAKALARWRQNRTVPAIADLLPEADTAAPPQPEPPAQPAPPPPPAEAAPESVRARHAVDPAEAGRSVLSGLAITAGSGGRRRAKDPEAAEPEPPHAQPAHTPTPALPPTTQPAEPPIPPAAQPPFGTPPTSSAARATPTAGFPFAEPAIPSATPYPEPAAQAPFAEPTHPVADATFGLPAAPFAEPSLPAAVTEPPAPFAAPPPTPPTGFAAPARHAQPVRPPEPAAEPPAFPEQEQEQEPAQPAEFGRPIEAALLFDPILPPKSAIPAEPAPTMPPAPAMPAMDLPPMDLPPMAQFAPVLSAELLPPLPIPASPAPPAQPAPGPAPEPVPGFDHQSSNPGVMPWQAASPLDLGWAAATPEPQPAPEPEPEPRTEPLRDTGQQRANRTGGRRRTRSDVRLADLLTEAMMAYQNVRDVTEQPDGPSPLTDPATNLPGPTSLPSPLAGAVGLHQPVDPALDQPYQSLDPAVGAETAYPRSARHRGETHFDPRRP